MNTTKTAAGLVGLLLLASFAAAHPPAADPHHACLEKYHRQGVPTPPVAIQPLTSYLAPLGWSPLPCKTATPAVAEFGSHSPGCFGVGPIPGAYCGPLVAPGAVATCTWRPVVNTVPTELVIGFDRNLDGFVRVAEPAYGTYPPGAWVVVNTGTTTARVIGFPTNIAMPGDPNFGVLPNDINEVICVTP